MTPIQLIQSWNVLNNVVKANDNPKFEAQAQRLQMQLTNDVKFWNNLDADKREAIADEELELNFTPIKTPPKHYPNENVEALNRFMAEDLEPKQTAIEKALSEKQPVNGTEQ